MKSKQPGRRRRNKSSLLLSPSPSPSPSSLCKVCTVSFISTPLDYYAVLIVDLESSSSDGYISTAPTFLLDCSHLNNEFYAFCVVGSILYMFAKGYPLVNRPPKGCSVYSVDLDHAKSESENLVLDKSMIRKLPDLMWPKFCTEAIPTPNGKKILVFSSMIYYNHPNLIQFELYDPFKNEGKKLPSPKTTSPNHLRHANGIPRDKYTIYSFAFLNDSVFLIQATDFGIFTIDINEDQPSWKKMDSFADSIDIPLLHRFYMLEDYKLCIDGSQAFTFLNKNDQVFDCCESSEFPSSTIADDFKLGGMRYVYNHIIYRNDGKLFGSVRFQMGISKYTKYAHMRVDVYKFDLDKFQKDIKKLGKGACLEISIHKTFKFVLDGYCCYHFMAGCCYPIVKLK